MPYEIIYHERMQIPSDCKTCIPSELIHPNIVQKLKSIGCVVDSINADNEYLYAYQTSTQSYVRVGVNYIKETKHY